MKIVPNIYPPTAPDADGSVGLGTLDNPHVDGRAAPAGLPSCARSIITVCGAEFSSVRGV